MSSLDLASIFSGSLAASRNTVSSSRSATTTAATGADFASSLSLRLSEFETQAMGLIFGATTDKQQGTSIFDLLSGTSSGTSGSADLASLLGAAPAGQQQSDALSASGVNSALADPQAAYRMMSFINTSDVKFKAQFAELSAMKSAVSGLEASSDTLGGVTQETDNDAIVARLQAFSADYNAWITRFDATVKDNGVLAGTRAAEVSLYELEQSVENDFNGATSGFHGVDELGLSIDQATKLATLDVDTLRSALTANKNGAVNTLREFSANFSKSADLLTSSGNFINNRLENLDGVIDFIGDNKSSLQAEFGLGDPAKPSAQVAKALATYNQIYAS